MKKLFNADVSGTNLENKVQNEKMENITANAVYFVEHSIYFADTMNIVTEPFNDDSSLALETDYIYAELDSIASEQSNRDCYRALIFLKDFKNVYLSYHSYGDVVSAEIFNDINEAIDNINSGTDLIKLDVTKLTRAFDAHEKNDKAHSATESVMPQRIALRTKDGILKAANPKESADLVTLEYQKKSFQEVEIKMQEKINALRTEVAEDIILVDDKVKIKTPVLTKQDFYPADYNYNGNPAIENKAQEDLDNKVSLTAPYMNVVRNKNGSVVIPEPKEKMEAVNKQTLDDVKQKISEDFDAHERNDKAHNATESVEPSRIALRTQNGTLKAANPKDNTDLVTLEYQTKSFQEAEIKTQEKINVLKQEIDELKNTGGNANSYTDIFKFDGGEISTNKIWNGKGVKRLCLTATLEANHSRTFSLIDNSISLITNIDGVITMGEKSYQLFEAFNKGVNIVVRNTKVTVNARGIEAPCTVYLVLEFIQ